MAFDTSIVDFVCPHCGHKLNEQRLFQKYEQQVATWLNGEVCAVNTPGFDVWKCAEFPDLTFQIKYSTVIHCDERNKRRHGNSPIRWQWQQGKEGNHDPNYFILIGLQDDGTKHYFLLGLNQWLSLAHTNSTGGHTLSMIPHPHSRKGKTPNNPSGYIHENKGWKYEVKNPEENLIKQIRTLESYRQSGLFR